MRDPAVVAQQIKAVIPECWKGDIDWHITHASYKPPEQHADCFDILSRFCNDILENERPLVTDWKIQMIEILIDQKLPNTAKEVAVNDYVLSFSDTDVRSLYRAMCELEENYGLNDSEFLLMERLRRLIHE